MQTKFIETFFVFWDGCLEIYSSWEVIVWKRIYLRKQSSGKLFALLSNCLGWFLFQKVWNFMENIIERY